MFQVDFIKLRELEYRYFSKQTIKSFVKMTIITKPLSQQEKEKKNGFIDKPVDEVFIKEGKNTSNVESAAVIPPGQEVQPICAWL